MKRADKRSSINILVLGDEGVGKSSLISTFVSRYFSEVVPGIMTRVRLPPDPNTSCVTTIVDSQNGDAALMQALNNVSNYLLQKNNKSETSLAALLERAAGGNNNNNNEDETITEKEKINTTAAITTTSKGTAGGKSETKTNLSSYEQQQEIMIRDQVPFLQSSSSSSLIENVDSIVLVYDLDRVETFFRLENHWLPLIERCYNGKVPVIIAENKMDLFRPSGSTARISTSNNKNSSNNNNNNNDEQQIMARKRQQIVSLMQRFNFVRQCIKCSAKNLIRVDDVFLKAQQAVLYPFVPPLYDLETGQLTIECIRAFTRIFRIFDKDHDGLLSDTELDLFQRETYYVPVFDRDLAAWKKVVTRNNPSPNNESVLEDGKFTIQGFLTIFDVFISQNRLDVVWQALRKFNYDDDLNLHVPESVRLYNNDYYDTTTEQKKSPNMPTLSSSSWKLTNAAKKFLTSVFRQFDSDNDGLLSPDDIIAMFSILPPPGLPPWHPIRAPELFASTFSIPKESPVAGAATHNNISNSNTLLSSTSTPSDQQQQQQQQPNLPSQQDSDNSTNNNNNNAPLIVPPGMSQLLSTSGVSILSASDSLPSVDVGGIFPLSKSLSYLEWMGHWHTISAISPSIARTELYRLGHVEDYSYNRRKQMPGRSRLAYKMKKKSSVSEPDREEGPGGVYYDTKLRSREVCVLVLGSRGCGKTALLNALCGSYEGLDSNYKATDTSSTTRPETSATFVRMKRSYPSNNGNGGGGSKSIVKMEKEGEEFVVHLVFTDVPQTAAFRQEEHFKELSELFGFSTSRKDGICDLAVLVFDCTDPSSLATAKELETALLTKDTPRVFVASKSDLVKPSEHEKDGPSKTVLDDAKAHCQAFDLEPPLVTSATEFGLGAGGDSQTKALEHLTRCALCDEPGVEHLKSRPHEEQKRREAARRRKMMWFGGLVSVGVVVAVGVGLLWGGSAKKEQTKSTFGWLKSFFNKKLT